MTRLRLGRSYWRDASRAHPPRLASLRGRHAADIAIVGGGITGCAAAMLFARAGASVILVDSQRLGLGSTLASTALLMQEPDVTLPISRSATEAIPRAGSGTAAVPPWPR